MVKGAESRIGRFEKLKSFSFATSPSAKTIRSNNVTSPALRFHSKFKRRVKARGVWVESGLIGQPGRWTGLLSSSVLLQTGHHPDIRRRGRCLGDRQPINFHAGLASAQDQGM